MPAKEACTATERDGAGAKGDFASFGPAPSQSFDLLVDNSVVPGAYFPALPMNIGPRRHRTRQQAYRLTLDRQATCTRSPPM